MSFRRLGLAPLFFSAAMFASTSPVAPVILEPEHDRDVVAPGDVHMVTSPFADADGDGHRCSDWEIVTPEEDVAWRAECATGAARLHIHMADGVFAAMRRELHPNREYRLRVRHRDDSGDPDAEWSAWSEREFRTSAPPAATPMRIRDILDNPAPEWNATPPRGASLRVELVDDVPLLDMQNGVVTDEESAPARSAIRIALHAGPDPWLVPRSELTFDDENGDRRTIYIPEVFVSENGTARFWVSANGGTHHMSEGDRVPAFDQIARGAAVPWTARERGFVVDHVAGGLQLPLDLAFAPDGSRFYVAELYGDVKAVMRGGDVSDFATALLDFDPEGGIPGTGEVGLGGITVDPENGDVLVTRVAWPDQTSGLVPQVVRLSNGAAETILSLPDELQAASHQISNITIGPDRKLYVHFGDTQVPEYARDMTTVRGKIVRLNLDGSVPEDNPFYDASDGVTARDLIFASGFRNPFGGAWRAADLSLYEVENGPAVDRFARVVAGRDYGWDGTNASMRTHALYTWHPAVAPVQVAFVQRETFDGSGFPDSQLDTAFVSESGPTWANGEQRLGKRISAIAFDGDEVAGAARPFVEYNGTGRATVSAVTAGPDGLYFADLYKDSHYTSPVDRGANVFRVRWAGYADFEANAVSADGRTVAFADRSDVPDATTRTWDFGDGHSSSETNPLHRFGRNGTYIVRLTVNGVIVETKRMRVGADDGTLTGDYFADSEFGGQGVTRDEPSLERDWGAAAPFSARWRGTLRPRYSETYRFTIDTNAEVRLFVDGEVIVPDDARHGEVELEAGSDYELVVELQHRDGDASIRVTWESDSQVAQLVPRSARAVEPSVTTKRRSVRR
ncbi:MAG TPA: PQQ-dependent sugar dehydrogenase [Thermoanaerobaculia bacterium]|nr:PQQ-dependent sugar dehydrogenase [Thermoanaerobaculia bacterium]